MQASHAHAAQLSPTCEIRRTTVRIMNINKCATELINDTPRFQLARQGASNRRGGARRAERAAKKERERERDS